MKVKKGLAFGQYDLSIIYYCDITVDENDAMDDVLREVYKYYDEGLNVTLIKGDERLVTHRPPNWEEIRDKYIESLNNSKIIWKEKN